MFIKQGSSWQIFCNFFICSCFNLDINSTLVNSNLPLDTIEALAWASDIQWGYSKHPPLSAWFSGISI